VDERQRREGPHEHVEGGNLVVLLLETCFANVLDDRLVEMEVATLVGDLA
jgi:hypothetical protein